MRRSVVALTLTLLLFRAGHAGSGGGGAEPGLTNPAEVLALRDVRVPAEVAGRVVSRPEKESAAVKEGEVVVALDEDLFRASVRAARAAANRATARLDWTVLELARARDLLAKGTIGKGEFDAAVLANREAAASHEMAKAAADEADLRLSRARIRTPFAGKLVRVYPQSGEYLRVGDTAFRIVDVTGLRIVTFVPASWLPRVREGGELLLETDAGSRTHGTDRSVLKAEIFSVAPAAEGASRTFRVEARSRVPVAGWRPGMTGRVRIPRGAHSGGRR